MVFQNEKDQVAKAWFATSNDVEEGFHIIWEVIANEGEVDDAFVHAEFLNFLFENLVYDSLLARMQEHDVEAVEAILNDNNIEISDEELEELEIAVEEDDERTMLAILRSI